MFDLKAIVKIRTKVEAYFCCTLGAQVQYPKDYSERSLRYPNDNFKNVFFFLNIFKSKWFEP